MATYVRTRVVGCWCRRQRTITRNYVTRDSNGNQFLNHSVGAPLSEVGQNTAQSRIERGGWWMASRAFKEGFRPLPFHFVSFHPIPFADTNNIVMDGIN